MTIEIFLMMLLACSILTTLTVEAIKKMFTNGEARKRKANIVAAVVAIVLAVAIAIIYAIMFAVTVNAQYIVMIIALCFLSWLCAMVGYDKVVQAIAQITGKNKEG
jgi:protein-S-isoprenylcysteine O-methyltransferase Ste14